MNASARTRPEDEPPGRRAAWPRVLVTECAVLLALYLFSRYFQ
jgi:hypothetical protein